MKAKIVITLNSFLYALPSVSHVPKRKRAVDQTPLFIHSFNKHLSLIRGLLFPARDGSCLSGSIQHSTAKGPPSCLVQQDRITTGKENLSDQHSNGGSAFVNTGKKGVEGEKYSQIGVGVVKRRENWGLLTTPQNCWSGCAFSLSRVFHVHT